jgi:hypothetical protein
METKSEYHLGKMAPLSLLQFRNLASNAPRAARPTGMSDDDYLAFLKNQFVGQAPPELAQRAQDIQNSPNLTSVRIVLDQLVTRIDDLVPPVHEPVSLNDVLAELRRFQRTTDPRDQTIQLIGYMPMIAKYIDVAAVQQAVLEGTPVQPILDLLVSDFPRRVTLLLTVGDTPPPPPFKYLAPVYAKYRAAYQVARDDTTRTQATQAYKNDILNELDGGVRPIQYPPTTTSAMGFYTPAFDPTAGTFNVYLAEATPGLNLGPGWSIQGLTGVYGNVTVTAYTANVYSDALISPGPPAVSYPYVSRAVVVADQPNLDIRPSSMLRMTLAPPPSSNLASNVTAAPSFSYYDPRLYDSAKIIGTEGRVRELGSNVATSEGRHVFHTVTDRGAGTGALTAMAAIGAQEPYMFGGQSKWLPGSLKQHTAFAVTQRLSLPLSNIGGYLGKTVQVDIFPREGGDLLTNMYLQCALPAGTYTELVGRALIDKVEFLVDGITYESITDDWYIIRDQLFLDADEKLGMYQAISGGVPEGTNVVAADQLGLIIPLEFFFCQRYTHGEKRTRPYFPLCALTLSTISVRFTFNTQKWITNTAATIDIIQPKLLIEEVTLTPDERMYFRSRPFTYKVPRVWKEATQDYNQGLVRMNLTANFPVTMMVWFVRNKQYETQDARYFESRYSLGYTTQYIQAATPVTFFNGVGLKYVDTIEYATLYLNNQNVLSNFPGGLYYTFKQSVDHGLSVPTKNIYMYCFSERPAEYNQGGALDFSTLNAQTTHLDIKFQDAYAPQIASDFSLNLFYYGYATLHIEGGACSLLK